MTTITTQFEDEKVGRLTLTRHFVDRVSNETGTPTIIHRRFDPSKQCTLVDDEGNQYDADAMIITGLLVRKTA